MQFVYCVDWHALLHVPRRLLAFRRLFGVRAVLGVCRDDVRRSSVRRAHRVCTRAGEAHNALRVMTSGAHIRAPHVLRSNLLNNSPC